MTQRHLVQSAVDMAKSELKLLSEKSVKAKEALVAAKKKLSEAEPTRCPIFSSPRHMRCDLLLCILQHLAVAFECYLAFDIWSGGEQEGEAERGESQAACCW